MRASSTLSRTATLAARTRRAASSTASSSRITLADWSHLESLSGGVRAPRAVRIIDLCRATQHLTPAKALLNAQLLHDELIARSALMVSHLLRLPKALTEHPSVAELMTARYTRLLEMVVRRPQSEADLAAFEDELKIILQQDGESRKAIGAALADAPAVEEGDQRRIDAQLDGVFSARIAIRFLTKHYFASQTPREGWSGSVQHACSPAERCELMARKVEARCVERFGRAPQILLHADAAQTFTFVPEHVDYVLRELMANASKATLQTHEGAAELPPVRVVVATGDDRVAITRTRPISTRTYSAPTAAS